MKTVVYFWSNRVASSLDIQLGECYPLRKLFGLIFSSFCPGVKFALLFYH